MDGSIERLLFAGTYVRTEIVKILFDDETVEQVFSVFVLVDGFSSGLSVFGDMSSEFKVKL